MKSRLTKIVLTGGGLLLLLGLTLGCSRDKSKSDESRFVIGVSNGWVGSEWRTQMIDELRAAVEIYNSEGVDIELIIQSEDVDVQGQISHIRNFITQRVDAIIINPNSPTGFDPIFKTAKERGILIIATDAEVSSKDALYVGIDHREWAALSARWLAKELGGKGNVVAINGVEGHAANEMRKEGYRRVLKEYPEITLLNESSGNWDQAQGQQVARTLLATYPDINGILVQDGMADGAWQAIEDAQRVDTIRATGEIRGAFLSRWKSKGYKSAASVNPPGCMVSALHVALLNLQGAEFNTSLFQGAYGNALYLPIRFITSENLDEAIAEVAGKPGYTSVTSSLTREEAAAFFR